MKYVFWPSDKHVNRRIPIKGKNQEEQKNQIYFLVQQFNLFLYVVVFSLSNWAGSPGGPQLDKTNKIQKLSDKWKTIFVEFWISKPSAELKTKCNGIISF